MAREKLTKEEKQANLQAAKEEKKARKSRNKDLNKRKFDADADEDAKSAKVSRFKSNKKERKNDTRVFIKNKRPYDRMKPGEGYIFCSDYFVVDGDQYCSILSFFHNEGAHDQLPPFWRINTIPSRLPDGVVVHRFDQITPKTQAWIDSHQTRAESIADTAEGEQTRGGDSKGRSQARRRKQDFEEIAQELLAGSAYLDVTMRLLVKAPSLEKLDQAIDRIDRSYKDRLGTIYVAPYYGDQKEELSNLYGPIKVKTGDNFMFTSEEWAGEYNLVTHGFEDVSGEYIGKMHGDVNSAAILFDCDNYLSHVCIAGTNKARTLSKNDFKRVKRVDLWRAKLSQAALMANQKVVHFLLSDCDLDSINPDLSSITSRIDLGDGQVNMFEVFRDSKDELSLFAIQLEKLKLMAQELYPDSENRGTLEGSLNDVLTDFYVDNNMWAHNAEQNREFLRITNIPHEEVPRLREFQAYVAQRYKASVASENSDPAIVAANRALNFLFSNMLTANGDIFDNITTDIIDKTARRWRVVYDFGSLAARGKSLIMAQFINIFGFAANQLNEGDVIFIHRAELISDIVSDFIKMHMRSLSERGVRIVWIYDNVEAMTDSMSLNKFDEADFTILGNMTANVATKYKETLRQAIPNELLSQISSNTDLTWYIRRRFDNVVFNGDMQLGVEY